jgi:ParB family chromosome partitioning protein
MTTTLAVKKRGLGRGLSHLLSDIALHTPSQSTEETTTHLPIEKLQAGKYQPRQIFLQEPLEELAESIRAQGIIQPIVVRKLANLRYEIIAGERRWRAAQIAGLAEVPVIVRDVPNEVVMAISLIENIQRENLNPLEEAHALKNLQHELNLTQQQVAEAVGKSRVAVTHLLGLLALHPEVQTYLQENKLDLGHAKTLMRLSLPEQAKVSTIIVTKNLSVRETEKLLKQWQSPLSPTKPKKAFDPNISALERKLSDQFSTPVIIKHSKKGRGKLIIHYRNNDILEGILEKFKE